MKTIRIRLTNEDYAKFVRLCEDQKRQMGLKPGDVSLETQAASFFRANLRDYDDPRDRIGGIN